MSAALIEFLQCLHVSASILFHVPHLWHRQLTFIGRHTAHGYGVPPPHDVANGIISHKPCYSKSLWPYLADVFANGRSINGWALGLTARAKDNRCHKWRHELS